MNTIAESESVIMPSWIKPRIGWNYAGWISRNPSGNMVFEELVERAKKSDHGECREVDIYPEGIACWFKEQST